MKFLNKTSIAGAFAGVVVTMIGLFGATSGDDAPEQTAPDALKPENPTHQTGGAQDPTRRTPPTYKPSVEQPTWFQNFLEAQEDGSEIPFTEEEKPEEKPEEEEEEEEEEAETIIPRPE